MDNTSFLNYAWGVTKLPGSLAYLALRLLKKEETLGTALQRLGWSSVERRNGPVLWFNVAGIGETSTVLPVIYRCLQEYNEKVTVLVTTPCPDVYKLLGDSLPQRVVVQLVPVENPITISAFLRKWQPQIGVFLETPFHRELALMARESGVRLALLNAHMPGEDLLEWHTRRTSRAVLKQTLSSYSLIVPRTYADVGRFRMFGATLGQMPGWSTDLQQASELGACAARLLSQRPKIRRSLLKRLGERQLWIAANTLPGEDAVVARIHSALRSRHKGLLTLVAPRVVASTTSATRAHGSSGISAAAYAAAARRLAAERRLQVESLSVVMQSPDRLSADVDVLVLDDPDALTTLYSLSEIVLVGGSLLPSLDGASSPAAAAVAGCALLMGPHGAEFLGMASDLNHAAILASEEVAAAVAQTGAAMRGTGFDTPRENREQPASNGYDGAAPVAGQWLDRPAAAAAAGPGGGGAVPSDGEAPGSTGPSWQQLVAESQRPVRILRPMSAPPTVPEHFQLRPEPGAYTLSPFGVSFSYESSLQLGGSSGPRGFFVAPFSTPGVSHGFGAPSPASRPCFTSTDQSGSAEFATPASAATATRTGNSRGRRRAIDRFRWASSREVIGFGYPAESDGEGLDSASSACDSDEDGQTDAEGKQGAGRGVFPVAADGSASGGVSGGRVARREACDPSGGAPSAASDAAVNVDACVTTSETALSAASAPPLPALPPASPRRTGNTASSSVLANPFAFNADLDGPDSDDDDEGDFHDAVEGECIEDCLPQEAPEAAAPAIADASTATTAPIAVVAKPEALAALSGTSAPQVDATPTSQCSAAESMASAAASGATSNTVAAPNDKQAPITAAVPAVAIDTEPADERAPALVPVMGTGAGNTAQVAVAEPAVKLEPPAGGPQASPYVPPPGPEILSLVILRASETSRSPERSGDIAAGGSDSGVRGSVIAAGDSGSMLEDDDGVDLPTVRGTHQGHLVICGDTVDKNDEDGMAWLSRQTGCRAARHLVSDPGLSTTVPLPRSGAAAGGQPRLSLQRPAAAPADAASSAASASSAPDGPVVTGTVPALAGEDTSPPSDAAAVLQALASASVGVRHPDRQIARAAPESAERPHLRSLGPAAKDDSALSETWASDVSMAALVDSPDHERESSGDLALMFASGPSTATSTREASLVWADSPQPSFRGSLDHYLQGLSAQAMLAAAAPPSGGRGRGAVVRGGPALTRLSGRQQPMAVGSLTNLAGLADVEGAPTEAAVVALEDVNDAPRGDSETRPETPGGDGDNDMKTVERSGDSGASLGDGRNGERLLPLPPGIITDGESSTDESSGYSRRRQPSPTVVSAAVPVSDGEEPDEALMGSSPTTIASTAACSAASAGGRVQGHLATAAAGPFAAGHPPHSDSPKSDFEFGGSVPDDTGSGSPTLLATASVHNGSGANLQAYVAADSSEPGSQQGDAGSQAGPGPALGLRPNSRTSSPSSTNSWSDPPSTASPSRPVVPPAVSRFPGPRAPVNASQSNGGSNRNPYEAGSCFAGQMSFKWLADGAAAAAAGVAARTASPGSQSDSSSGRAGDGSAASSDAAGPTAAAAAAAALPPSPPSAISLARHAALSTAVSATSIGSRNSTGFHQVASIGSWLDEFGSTLSHPSLGLQRSQAQHDPMSWFSQRGAAGGTAVPAAALEGVAPGLRAPMHSPLRMFDDDLQLGINPQALASVTTTLFPSAHVAPAFPAPMPPQHVAAAAAAPASPRAPPPGASATSSSPLRSVSSVSSEQVTSAFTVGRSQYTAPAAASAAAAAAGAAATVLRHHVLAPASGYVVDAAATVAVAAPRLNTQDALSALLNSPRSPVSPVRVSRVVSPAMDRRAAGMAAGQLASPARPAAVPAAGLQHPLSPAAAAAGYASPPPPSRRSPHVHGAEETEAWPLPVALPTINTPRRELQRRQSAPVRRASPATSSPPPLQSTHSVVPGAAAAVATDLFAGTWLERDRLGAAPGAAALGFASWPGPAVPASPRRGLIATAAAGPGAGLRQPDDDSPRSSETSSCPNTPTSRAADNASSPFRGPKPAGADGLHLSSPAAHLPPMQLSADGEIGGNFEASFEAAVRAGPARSPARSVSRPGSVHVSPYSSPYRSPFAAAMKAASGVAGGSRSPGPGTAFRSLFLEEEEEELAAGGGGLDEEEVAEDPMPLSPRANSHNVLFSMREPRDDACGDHGDGGIPSGAALGLSRDAVFNCLTRGVAPAAAPAAPAFMSPPHHPPPLLPSATSATSVLQTLFSHQRHMQLLRESGITSGSVSGSAAASRRVSPTGPATVPAFGSRMDVNSDSPTEPVIEEEPDPLGFCSVDPISPTSGLALVPGNAGLPAAAAAVAVAAGSARGSTAARTAGSSGCSSGVGGISVSSLVANLDSAPTFSRIPSLSPSTDEEDVGGGSSGASPARGFPHLSSSDGVPVRQPRITLSGGPLVVPAVEAGEGGGNGGASHPPLGRSHLSHASGPRREEGDDEEDELEGEPSMELPLGNSGGAAGDEDETPRHIIPQPIPPRSVEGESSRRASCCSSIASASTTNPRVSTGGSVGQASGRGQYGMAAAQNGSAGSLASSSTATTVPDRYESPPRSPADRTSCPRSSCPSASPVKPPLHSTHSSPVLPRSAFAAPCSPKLPHMPALPSSQPPSNIDAAGTRRWYAAPLPQSPPHSPPLLSPRASTSRASQAPFSSPPTAYMSPCATDPRASPIKVMTAVKRTPSDAPSGPMPQPLPTPTRGPGVAGVAAPAPFSSGAAAGVAATIFGPGVAANPSCCLQERLSSSDPAPSFSGMAPLRTQPSTGAVPASPASAAAPAASPRHRSPAAAAPWQPWLAAAAAGGAGNDEPLLATRASAPAGFFPLSADRGMPSTPRSGRRDPSPVFSPAGPSAGMAPGPGQAGGAASATIRGSASQSLDVHAQRNQQQQAWDRARAESRTASAAGTPRSARALFAGREDGSGASDAGGVFGGPPALLVSFSSSTCGFFNDVCVSPVEAPRSPRVGASSAGRPPVVFALDAAAAAAAAGPAAAMGAAASSTAEEESWLQQHAQLMRHASGGQGTARSARVLFPPASPQGQPGVSAAGGASSAASAPPAVAVAGAEPPSPSWSHVSRQLFPEGSAASGRPAGTMTPGRRPVGQVDTFLARMTVQVASPVSPQPRLQPPPASPRMLSPGKSTSTAAAEAAAAAAAASSSSSGAARRNASFSKQRPNSPLLQTALLQQARKTSTSGEQPRASPQRPAVAAPAPGGSGGSYHPAQQPSASPQDPPLTFRSPGAAAQPQWGQRPLGMPSVYGVGGGSSSNNGSVGGGQPPAMSALPHLPQLPPLPCGRQLPNLLGLGAAASCLPATMGPSVGAAPAGWPMGSVHTAASGTPADSHPDSASVDTVRRLLFRQSAPQLLSEGMPMPTALLQPPAYDGGPSVAGSIALPAMPPAAEQEALAALESQFRIAEQEAAGLPIETRVATPPAAAVMVNCGDGATTGGMFGGAGFGAQAGRPSTAPDYGAGRQGGMAVMPLSPRAVVVAPPSPRGVAMAPPSPRAASGGWQPALGAGAGAGSRAGSAANCGDIDRLESKPPVQMAAAAPVTMAAAQVSAGAGPSSSAGAALKQQGAGATAAGAAQRAVGGGHGHQELSRAGAAGGGGGGRRQDAGLRPANGAGAPSAASRQQAAAHAGGFGGMGATPGRVTGHAVRGNSGSPLGSTCGGPGAERELFVAPCARYAGQFLIPAAQLTSDPRLGPAVWMVSNEEELAAALSRLLQDSIERQSRGRAAAQGAAKLASSLVTTVWSVLEDMVIAPALQQYISSTSTTTSGDARAAR